MDLTSYRTFGRSGLLVSPLALGTMTFGIARWGAGERESRAIFDSYLDAGGNFVDTADVYAAGRSEEFVGRFVADRGARDHVVIATKSGFATGRGPHQGGNGAKHVRAALDCSLRRLATEYVDLYWAHVWDTVTPIDELLRTLTDLVRAGTIRYYGLSNAPAWYVTRFATLAAAHGLPLPVAVQLEYSLVERHIEREHLPAARELGLGVQPWSPLAGGFLTGKYHAHDPANVAGQRATELPDRAAAEDSWEPDASDGRLRGANPFGDAKFTERNWRILHAVRTVADSIGRTPADVALAWVVQQPGIVSPLIGASRTSQVQQNVAALAATLDSSHLATLDDASALEAIYPYTIFTPAVRRMVFGGADVHGWHHAPATP